jgi:hypothetical protein
MSGTRRKPGPLGPYVEGYRSWLLGLGYSPLSVTRSLTALGHLGRWMAREGVDVEQLDGGAVEAFLRSRQGPRAVADASVMPLLHFLRAQGVVASEPAASLTALSQVPGRGVEGWCSSRR